MLMPTNYGTKFRSTFNAWNSHGVEKFTKFNSQGIGNFILVIPKNATSITALWKK